MWEAQNTSTWALLKNEFEIYDKHDEFYCRWAESSQWYPKQVLLHLLALYYGQAVLKYRCIKMFLVSRPKPSAAFGLLPRSGCPCDCASPFPLCFHWTAPTSSKLRCVFIWVCAVHVWVSWAALGILKNECAVCVCMYHTQHIQCVPAAIALLLKVAPYSRFEPKMAD